MITGEADGPRERARDVGFESLGDSDLLAILLGTGCAGRPVTVVASALLDGCGGLVGLGRAGVGGLSALPGIGSAKGARIAAAMELGRRVAASQVRAAALHFPASDAVASWAFPRLAGLPHEELWLLALDGRNRLTAARRLAAGGQHSLSIAAVDVLRAAIREGANSFLLLHNHPSGDPTPSDEDIVFSRAVATLARAVGTPLTDHVVIGRPAYCSMLDRGLLLSTDA